MKPSYQYNKIYFTVLTNAAFYHNSPVLQNNESLTITILPPYFNDGLKDNLSDKEIRVIRRDFNVFDDNLLKVKAKHIDIKLNNGELTISNINLYHKRFLKNFIDMFNKRLGSNNINYLCNNNSKFYWIKFWRDDYIVILDRVSNSIINKRCFNLKGLFISKTKDISHNNGKLYRQGEFFTLIYKDNNIISINKTNTLLSKDSLKDFAPHKENEEEIDNTNTSLNDPITYENLQASLEETTKEKVTFINHISQINDKFQMYIKIGLNKVYEKLYREVVSLIKILIFAGVFIITIQSIKYIDKILSYINWMYEILTKIWENTIPVINRDITKISETISENLEALIHFILRIDWHDWGLIFEETNYLLKPLSQPLRTGYLWLILDKNPLVYSDYLDSLQSNTLVSNFIDNHTINSQLLTNRVLNGQPLIDAEISIPFWQWCLAVAAVIVIFSVGRNLWDGWVRSNEEFIQRIRDEAAQQAREAAEETAEVSRLLRQEANNASSLLLPRVEDAAQKTEWVKEITDKGLLTQKQLIETKNQLNGAESLLSAREWEIKSLANDLKLKADELKIKSDELVLANEDIDDLTDVIKRMQIWVRKTLSDHGLIKAEDSPVELISKVRSGNSITEEISKVRSGSPTFDEPINYWLGDEMVRSGSSTPNEIVIPKQNSWDLLMNNLNKISENKDKLATDLSSKIKEFISLKESYVQKVEAITELERINGEYLSQIQSLEKVRLENLSKIELLEKASANNLSKIHQLEKLSLNTKDELTKSYEILDVWRIKMGEFVNNVEVGTGEHRILMASLKNFHTFKDALTSSDSSLIKTLNPTTLNIKIPQFYCPLDKDFSKLSEGIKQLLSLLEKRSIPTSSMHEALRIQIERGVADNNFWQIPIDKNTSVELAIQNLTEILGSLPN